MRELQLFPLLAAFILWLPQPLLSQRGGAGVLEGRVLIAADGRPAADIVVRLDDHRSQTLDLSFTDSSGRFRFVGVPLNNNGALFLTVTDEAFDEIMERIDLRQLRGLHTLYLVRRNVDRPPPPPGDNPFSVDVGQLAASVPDDARRAYDEGVRDSEEDRIADAIDRFERAVELAPRFYDAWIKLGIAYMASGNDDDAERAYRAARDVNPIGTLAPLNLGILRYRQGETAVGEGRPEDAARLFVEAGGFLNDAVTLNPTAAQAHFYRGAALYQLAAYSDAESSLLRAVELDPFSRARLTLINVYVRLNRADLALAQAEAFLVDQPDAPESEAIESVRQQLRDALGL